VLLLLAALDPLVASLLERQATFRSDRERADVFANVVFRSFEEANRSVNASISRAHRLFAALPEEKAEDEIRVFAIGNSAALFAVAPEEIRRRLQRAYPDRRVTLTPFLIPDIGVVDERRLVLAALSKGADLLLLMPNLKGMIIGREVRMRFLRDLFGEPPESRALEWPGDVLRRSLVRHWRTFRSRDELRQLALERFRPSVLDGRAAERRAMEEAFEEISRAAGRGDVAGLLRIYQQRGMQRFVPAGLPQDFVPTKGAVFRNIRATAEQVRAAGALGVAIFLPVNPLFRDPAATRDHPELRVHDPTLRKLARLTLEAYERSGFATADRLDALPPTAFIDLVHANATGMSIFTERAANITIRALRALEARDGRALDDETAPGGI
jgi:hypothetical protein